MNTIHPATLARMIAIGYLLTIAFETPVLYFGLGSRYTPKEKLLAGLVLTLCSYPFVVLLFPSIWNPYSDYGTYVLVSEIFAPVSECVVFAILFQRKKQLSSKPRLVDFFWILMANLTSFSAGELLKKIGFHF